ncbi:MAG TPA: Ig-like domain-containing protein [Gammaproteobacteria bacterium]|nr:Ig-like domain-containing protein [Gammaproteobacteria bacterium]
MYQRCLSILLCGALCVVAGCSEDKFPPRIVISNPGGGATSGNRDLVRLQFNEEILDSSVEDDSITLVRQDGQQVSGKMHHGAKDSEGNEILKDMISFFPDERLRLVTKYHATLKRGISDLDGNKIQEDILWSYTVRDGNFSGATALENNISDAFKIGHAFNPQISMNPADGSGFIVWRQFFEDKLPPPDPLPDPPPPVQGDGSLSSNIFVKKLNALKNDPETRLSAADNNNDALAPQIAVSSNRTAMVVWSQSDGANSRIYANRFDSNNWQNSLTLTPIDAGNGPATAPQIVIDANGNALVVWIESDRVYYNRYLATTDNWTGAATIDASLGNVAAPQIAIDTSGQALAIWVENSAIYINRFNGATWGGATPIPSSDNATTPPTSPQIAMDADGTTELDRPSAIAVWSQVNGTDSDIMASSYSSNGGWTSAVIIDAATAKNTKGDMVSLVQAETPQVAMAPNGTAIAVWVQKQGAGMRKRVFSRRFKFSKSQDKWTWTEEAKRIDNSAAPAEASEPQIAVDGQGNALCVWSEVEGGPTNTFTSRNRHNIYANRFRVSFNGWNTPILLEDDTARDKFNLLYNYGDAISPQLAVAPDYSAVIIWTKANHLDDPDDPSDDTSFRYDIQRDTFN